MTLDTNEITLDGQAYRLARTDVVNRVLGVTARRWQEKLVPKATKRVPRDNVRPGDIPGEWVITYDDWSKGVSGDHDPIPGTIHACVNVDPTVPGSLRTVGLQTSVTWATASGADPCRVLIEGALATILGMESYPLLVVRGRYLTSLSNNAQADDRDFEAGTGTGQLATDAAWFNRELVVGFGGSTHKIQVKQTTYNGSFTWTEATDATYATYFAIIQNLLWRATATNQVSHLFNPTDDPLTLANWTAGIVVGDDTSAITGLAARGKKLVVAKTDGLYLGDEEVIFPNQLEHLRLVRDPDNGKGLFVYGASIFYPHRNGLILYHENDVPEEIGIHLSKFGASTNDESHGFHVTALCADGQYIWAATEHEHSLSVLEMTADPTGFRKTVDNEVNFTNYTTNVGDNDRTTVADLTSLGTAAQGDYFYIGYSSTFWGFIADLLKVNQITTTLTLEYWNGSAWATITAANIQDGTLSQWSTTIPFRTSGSIVWESALANWATKSIDGTTAYWIRGSISVAFESYGPQISECRIITKQPASTIFRGRRRVQGDPPGPSILWEPVFQLNGVAKVTAMAVTGRSNYDYPLGTQLQLASRQFLYSYPLAQNPVSPPLIGMAGTAYLSKDDAGMPEVNKQWIDVTVKGRTINATHVLTSVGYRVDETVAYTNVATNTNSSPTTTAFSAITGRALQLGVNYAAPTGDQPTEINEIEVRFRELPTYKEQFVAILEVADEQATTRGGRMPAAGDQLTNLLADLGAGTVTLIDPTGRSQSVTVDGLQVLEAVQTGVDYPSLLVEILMNEV